MRIKITVITLFLLSSCKQNEIIKTPIFHISITDDIFLKLDKEAIYKMKENKLNFPLYVYQENCGACDIFYSLINEYIKEENICFPFIYLDEYKKIESYNPSSSMILIYNKGKIINSFTTDNKVSTLNEMKSLFSQCFYDSNKTILNDQIKYESNLYTLDFSFYEEKINKKCLLINEKTFDDMTYLLNNQINNVYFSSEYFSTNRIEESIIEYN